MLRSPVSVTSCVSASHRTSGARETLSPEYTPGPTRMTDSSAVASITPPSVRHGMFSPPHAMRYTLVRSTSAPTPMRTHARRLEAL
eukprot:2867724-Rhodomonas_salina.1